MKEVLLLVCLFLSVASSAEIVKWTDENGKVHFGDKVPPEYADQSTQVEIETNVVTNENRTNNKKVFNSLSNENKVDRSRVENRNNPIPKNIPKTQKIDFKDCANMPSKAIQIKCERRKYQRQRVGKSQRMLNNVPTFDGAL